MIASVAGELAILMGGFFRTVDRVRFGGIVGNVIDIGVLRSTLMECDQWVKGDLYNGRIVRVASSFGFEQPVFNYSGDPPFLRNEIVIAAKYGRDAVRAREILDRVALELLGCYADGERDAWKQMVARLMIEDARVDPVAPLVLNDNWMEFTLRYVVEYKRRRLTKDLPFTRFLTEFQATGGTVSFVSATFQLVEAPVIDVCLTGAAPQAPPRAVS